jgi:hypothetical protein
MLPTQGETFCHPFVEALFNNIKIVCLDNAISKEICTNNAFFAKKNIISIKDNVIIALNHKTDFNLKLLHRYNSDSEFNKTFALLEK